MALQTLISRQGRDTTDEIYLALQNFIQKYYFKRRNAITRYWDYWRGGDRQKIYLRKYEGESDAEHRMRVDRAVIENHCKTTININAAFMYGMSDKIVRRAFNQTLNKILHDEVYHYNEMSTLMMDTRLMTAITGNAVMELMIYDTKTRRPIQGVPKKGNFYVRYGLNDSGIVIPIPRVYDRRELGAVIKYYELEDIDQFESLGITYKPGESIWVLEYITDDLWLRWYHSEDNYENPTPIPVFRGGESNANPFGDVRVPFVLFKNVGDPMNLDGESDLEDVIPLQDNLNERMTDDAITIAYHAIPLLLMLGGAKLPDKFIRKPNSALELEGEGDARYLTWEDKLEASKNYKDDVRISIAETTSISQLTRGNMKSAGQLRTGIGVKTMFVPDLIGVRMRRPYMVKGEKDLIYATARMYEYYGKYDFGGDYKCEVVMPEDFLGIDEWMETQIMTQKIQSGMPLKEELKQDFPDLSDEQLERLEQKIREKATSNNKPGVNPPQDGKQMEKE